MSKQIVNWKSIIWREIHYADDPDYAERLYLAVTSGYFKWFEKSFYRLRPRAFASEVEAALYQISQVEWSGKHAWARYLRRLERERNKNVSLEKLIDELQSYHWLRRFIARHVLLYRGGEAVERLQPIASDDSAEMQQTASWLIKSIGVETSERLAQETEKWVCSQCFVRCDNHHLLWKPILTYYGCRACKRSWGLLYIPQEVICVLDEDWSAKYEVKDNLLKVNWMLHRTTFDFDRVNIIQATDEDVERFAIQIGNDTDPLREAKYSKIQCHIDEGCQLSINTVRILENRLLHCSREKRECLWKR
jgi:hypothetical protein